jgi:hypothetical protein
MDDETIKALIGQLRHDDDLASKIRALAPEIFSERSGGTEGPESLDHGSETLSEGARTGLLGEWDLVQAEIDRRGWVKVHSYYFRLSFQTVLTDALYYAATGKRAAREYSKYGWMYAREVTPMGLDDLARWRVIDPVRGDEVGKLLSKAILEMKRDDDFIRLSADIERETKIKRNEVNTARRDEATETLYSFIEDRGDQGTPGTLIREEFGKSQKVSKRIADLIEAGRIRAEVIMTRGKPKTYYPVSS